MRTAAEEAALAAFIDSATSDVDPGYPYGAAFVPWEQGTSTNRILERYLREGRPVVLVADNGFELLVEPPSSAEVIAFALDQPVGGERHTDPAMPRHLAEMIARGEVGPGNGARHSPKPVRGREGGKSASEYVSEGRR